MGYETILFELAEGIARITLNRPDKLNSLNATVHGELRDALAKIRGGGARVLLLSGAGRAFCAGQDLSERAVAPGAEAPDLGLSIETHYKPLVVALRNLELPVICAVNGVAAGAGANIALACDIVLAARSASFIQAFCRIGLMPDSGGTFLLPHLIGSPRAMGLALLGERLSAEQAEAWGLIWKCVDDGELPHEADKLARQFAAGPGLAYARTKQAIYAAADHSLEAQLDLERDFQRELGRTADYREGVTAFMAKRAPEFKGR